MGSKSFNDIIDWGKDKIEGKVIIFKNRIIIKYKN